MTDPSGRAPDNASDEASETVADNASDEASEKVAERLVTADRQPGRWRTAVPMLLVVGLLAVGLILISLAHWRRGTGSIALALALAAGMRLFIAPEKLGPLVIRSRTFDVLFCLLLSGLLVSLALGWFSTELTG